MARAIGTLSKSGEVLTFGYQRAKAAVLDGLVFVVEGNDTLAPETWSGVGVDQLVISDDGTVQEVAATLPASNADERFARLRVLAP